MRLKHFIWGGGVEFLAIELQITSAVDDCCKLIICIFLFYIFIGLKLSIPHLHSCAYASRVLLEVCGVRLIMNWFPKELGVMKKVSSTVFILYCPAHNH